MHKVAIIDYVGIKAGMDNYSGGLAEGFVARGLDVTVISNFEGNQKGIEYVSVFNAKREGLISDAKNWIVPWRKASKHCVKAGIKDVVIHLFSFGFKDRLAMGLLKRAGLRMHVVVHDPEHLGKGEGPFDFKTSMLGAAHRIYVHNKVSAAFLPAAFQDRARILQHGNFHDIPSELSRDDARSELDWKDSVPRVLFFGQIKTSKGLDILIDAMPHVKAESELVIAGRPWQDDTAQYTDVIKSKGIKAETHLRFITNEERDRLFKAASLIVVPYRKIFQSGVLQMAFSYKLPVVCSDLPAFKELDANQSLTQQFQTENAKDLARVIDHVLASLEEMKAQADRAYTFAEEHCSWTAIAKGFEFD